MYQPWKWLKRGNNSRFSHCRNGTKLLVALKVLLDDISPELQYLPRKYNSEFFVCTHRTQRNEPKIGHMQISCPNTTWCLHISQNHISGCSEAQWNHHLQTPTALQMVKGHKLSFDCIQPVGATGLHAHAVKSRCEIRNK